MVEWSCTKERLNERGPYIFVEWSFANKINKSVGTLYSSRIVVYIASAKILEREESISPSSFYGQLPTYYEHVFSLIYQVDEFSLKEMWMWGQSKISSYCFCVWRESRELGGRGSSRFPCLIPMVETSSDRVKFRIPSNTNDGAPLQKQPTGLTR